MQLHHRDLGADGEHLVNFAICASETLWEWQSIRASGGDGRGILKKRANAKWSQQADLWELTRTNWYNSANFSAMVYDTIANHKDAK